MKRGLANQTTPSAVSPGLGARWLHFFLGRKKLAVRLDCLVRVLDQTELFAVPLSPPEFKGIIYFNERAVPILNWEAFGIETGEGKLVLVLEQGKDWVGFFAEATGGVEEYLTGPGAREDGFWIELDSEQGIWGLEEKKFFNTLRQKDSKPGR